MSPNERALVVEDDRSWQEILGEILAEMGFAVDVVATLGEALLVLRQNAHRLAVVDLSLQSQDHHNRDGLEVLAAIRRRDPNCVGILLTGYATVELAVNAITELGAVTCLRKENFRRREFRELIRHLLTHPPSGGDPSAGFDAATAPTAVEPTPAAPAQAIVVEDDAGWRSILVELLADIEIGARACTSYGEALGLMRRESFALAVVDLSLASSLDPDDNADGYRVLASARAAGIPAIVVSGTASPEAAERTYTEYQAFACFEKQAFDRGAFRTTAKEAVSSRGNADSGVTAREQQVLQLLSQGLTNKEIATELIISTNTVKRHLKSIFEKLGVNTRAAAVAKIRPRPADLPVKQQERL